MYHEELGDRCLTSLSLSAILKAGRWYVSLISVYRVQQGSPALLQLMCFRTGAGEGAAGAAEKDRLLVVGGRYSCEITVTFKVSPAYDADGSYVFSWRLGKHCAWQTSPTCMTGAYHGQN